MSLLELKISLKKSLSIFAASALAVALLASCNVGLGETVDTTAPTLNISYPGSSAVIRGSFVLAGTCDDDKGISYVEVSITNISTNTSYGTKRAVLAADGKSWTVELNAYDASNSSYYNGYEFPDGKYDMDVVAKDGAGRSSGPANLSVEIDNTPPVFVITKPGVVYSATSSVTPSAYGSYFTISGTIAEDHSVSAMDVVIYSEDGSAILSKETYDGEAIDSFRTEDVPTAGGTSVTICQSGAEDGRYSAVYGDDESAGTKNFRASIKLTDSAKTYKTPPVPYTRTSAVSDDMEDGNSTYSLYLYDDVYDALLAKKISTSLKLEYNDLKNILNGTQTNTKALAILKDAVTDTTPNKDSSKNLYFSLNPQANPSYEITGFSFDFDNASAIKKGSSDSTISGKVVSGLDGTLIDPDGTETSDSTIKVWIKEYDAIPESEGSLKTEMNELAGWVYGQEKEKTSFVEYSQASSSSACSSFSNWNLIYDYPNHNSASASSDSVDFSFDFSEVYPDIRMDKYYIFCLTGADKEEVEVLQNKVYGFIGNEAGVAPSVAISSPANLSSTESSDSVVFAGTASLASSASIYVSELIACVSVTDKETGETVGDYDVVSPSAESEFLAQSYAEVLTRTEKGGDWASKTNDGALAADSDGNWTFTPSKLSKYADIEASKASGKSYLYTLYVYAKSSTGQGAFVSSTVEIDAALPSASIDGVSPTVSGSSFFGSGDENSYINGTVSVTMNVSDNSKISAIVMKVLVDDEEAASYSFDDINSVSKKIVQSIDTTALKDGGKLDIELTATDAVGNVSTAKLSDTEDYAKLYVNQETDKPRITLNNASYSSQFLVEGGSADNINADNGNLFGVISNNRLSGTIEDDDIIKYINARIYKENGETELADYALVKENDKSSYTLSWQLPSDEGTYIVEISATDDVLGTSLSGRNPITTTTGKFYIAVSSGAPTINLGTVNTYQTETPSFSGTVSSLRATVSAEVSYSEDGETKTKALGVTPKTELNTSGTVDWTATLDEGETLSNNDYTVIFTATNSYGEKNSAKAEFTVDNEPPKLSITEYNSIANENGYTSEQKYYINPEYTKTVKGTSTDAVSGVDNVYFVVGDIPVDSEGKELALKSENGWTAASISKDGKYNATWTASLTELSSLKENTEYTMHIKAVDVAGNRSEDNTVITVIIDKTLPATTVVPKADGSTLEALDDGSYITKQAFTLSGVVTEDNLESIKVNNSAADYDEASKTWTYSPAVEADGTFIYNIALTDKAGNSSSSSVTVIYDTTAPNLTVTSPIGNSNTNSDGSFTIEGSASDNGSGMKSVSYAVYKSSDVENGTPKADATAASSGSVDVSSSGAWAIEVSGEGKALSDESNYTLFVTAKDQTGNTKTAGSVEFYYDKSAPDIEVSIADEPIGEASVGEGDSKKTYNVYASSSLNVKAETKDSVSGVANVVANSTTSLKADTTAENTYIGTVVASLASDGTTSISVAATDKAGFSKAAAIDNIMVDIVPPALAITAKPDAAQNGPFTLSGTVSDNVALESVTVTDSLDTSKTYTAVVSTGSTTTGTSSTTTGTWSLTLTPTAAGSGDNETKDGSHTYTVKATDKAGLSTTVICQVTTDVTKPEWATAQKDSSSSAKEPYVKNDGKTVDVVSTTSTSSIAEARAYYNSTSLTIAAKATDATSGVESLYYNLNEAKNDDNSAKWIAADNANFTIEAKEGADTLAIKAKDAAGNESAQTTLVFYVDSLAPNKAELKSLDGTSEVADYISGNSTKLVNGTKDIVFTLDVADDMTSDASTYSGIGSVKVTKIGSSTPKDEIKVTATTATTTDGTTTYEITIPKGSLATGAVTVTVTDKAGNSKDFAVFNLLLDNKKPSVTLNAPTDADSSTTAIDVNQIISLSGTASDNQKLNDSSIYLEYTTSEPTEGTTWTKLTGGTDGNAGESYAVSCSTSFKASGFDTKKFENLKTIYVRAAAADEAENIGHSDYISLYVNQDSDRPVINITSLDESGSDVIISSQALIGTISDDDGVSKLEYSSDSGTSWNEITVSSGSWKIENLVAGDHSLTFKVTDSWNGVFTTGDTSGTDPIIKRPYISYAKSTEKADNSTPTFFAIDLAAPVINTLKIASSADSTALTEDSELWASGTVNFGKSSKYMSILIKANEDVRVHSSAADDISVKVGASSLSSEVAITRTPTNTLKGDLVYIIGPVDVSSISGAEGTITVSITVKDASGRESSATQNIYVDAGAPEVSITSPNATAADAATGKTNGVSTTTEAITGKYTIKGRVADTSGIAKFKYLIPTNEQIKTISSTSDFTSWTSVETLSGEKIDSYTTPLSSSQWAISFDSSSFDSPTDALSLIYYATAKTDGTLTYATAVDGSTTGQVYVPLYFYVEDATGNGEIVENKILVDPQGGIPTVEITSHEEKDGSIPKTGTTVSLMGTATDDEKVASVKITKVEYATDDTVSDSTTWTALTATQLAGTTDKPVVTKGTLDSSSGIITAEGTTSWKASVNVQNISGASGTIKALRFTVESYDENGTSSAKEYPSGSSSTCTIRIYVDAGNPTLKKSSIVGFTSAPADVTATPDWEKSYTAGMYFSGNAKTADGSSISSWYLKAVVTDDTSVTDVALSTQTGSDYVSAMTDFGSSATASGVIASGADSQTYTVLIPISVTSEGKVYATLTMNDGQHTDVTSSFTFNIDNTAPTVYGTDGNALTSDTASSLRLTSLGETVGDENVVENSDGSYTFGDSLLESGSGLAYVAFYFKKSANSKNDTNRVYNPMYNAIDGTANSNKVTLADSAADGEVYINSEGLPALYKTGVTVTNENGVSTVTFSGLGDNYNINNAKWCEKASSYGLVKIAGSYHKITAISGDVATLEDTVSSTNTTAEFIYAMLVDHEVTEGFDSTSDTLVSNDDGDGLVEMVKRTGTTYKWSASVYSDNIPDGPAEIHIVAFDEAGNSTHGYVSTSIQNNRPRIARLYLATDLNANGTFDYYNESTTAGVLSLDDEKATGNGAEFGELVFYSALDSEGKVQGNAVLSTNACRFVASGDTLVMPEFVGGNGELKYAMTVSANDAAASTVGKTTADSTSLKSLYSDVTNLKLADKDGTTGKIADLLSAHVTVDSTTRAISDSGTNSGSYKGFILSKDDLTQYESWIGDTKSYKYFAFTFWDSTDETTQGTDSLYALLKVPLIVNVVDDVKPTAAIKPFWWNSKDDSSFVYNDDGEAQGHIALESGTKTIPGVSGKIYIDGTAYDETRLKEIYVKEPSGAEYLIASYADGAWTVPTKISATTDTSSKEKWILDRDSVAITTVTEPSQSGHKVKFRVAVDMTAYGVAKNDDTNIYAIEAYAKDDSSQDSGSNTSVSSTTQTAAGSYDADESKWTPYYKVDFVPYIKSIYTTDIGSANRSRLGKFPVRAGESMTIEGMNFAKDATYTVSFYKSDSAQTNRIGTTADTAPDGVTDWSGTISTAGSITVTAPSYSRWVTVTVGGVATPNNDVTDVSSIPGCDIEEGYVVDSDDNGLAAAGTAGTNFWTNNRYIAVWNVGTTFSDSTNPIHGTIEKLSTDDAKYVANEKYGKNANSSLPDNTLYAYWGADDNMIWDEILGKSRTYSLFSQSDAALQNSVSEIDTCIVGGNVFVAALDNTLLNSGTYGPGLVLIRDGQKFKSTDAGNYKYTVELIKEDKMKYQFPNPKIAGWHGTASKSGTSAQVSYTTSCWMYISYYDAYTKCLKYGLIEYADPLDSSNSTDLIQKNVAADDSEKTKCVVAGTDSTSSTTDAGQWSDIKILTEDSKPIPVIVYYEKTGNTKGVLKLAKASKSMPTAQSEWTSVALASPSKAKDFGRYVSMELDSSSNLHIVAQDVTNGILYYGCFKSDGTEVVAWTKVDATDSVGRWTDIKLENPSAENSGLDAKPVVAYMNTGKLNTSEAVKVAYIDNGAFEAMTDPASYEASDEKLSIVTTPLESSTTNVTSRLGIGINSTMLAVDFLRGEE